MTKPERMYYAHVQNGMDNGDMDGQKPREAVNHPDHYNQGRIECIDAIQAALTPEEYRGFLKGQVMRYTWRLGLKDAPAQEAGKMSWYAERLKNFMGGK